MRKRRKSFEDIKSKSSLELAQMMADAILHPSKKKPEPEPTIEERIQEDAENGYFDDAVSDPEIWDKYYGAILRGEKPTLG